ncbi:hypothetical protein PLICRDRAFT_164641 [Plicaturopsis crispa FD-325 SS-3]|nr:hypothetical protein PLICRDRAFT_164641 [Plicaturopsis crispa FD-325 SS-3]
MHPCLETLDVLALIFGECGLPQSDLARLARTCKWFCEPALDSLWREQTDLRHVLKCLGPEAWMETRADGEKRMRRPIIAHNWKRFRFYADRIKICRLSKDAAGLTSSAVSALLVCAPTLPLLQNVRTLGCENELPDEVLVCTRLVMGPATTEINFGYQTYRAGSLGELILSSLIPSCPNIKRFGVANNVTPQLVADIASGDWADLESLTIGSLPAPSLLEISALPKLRELDFIWSSTGAGIGDLEPDGHRFSALRSLTITFEGMPALATLAEACIPVIGLSHWPSLEAITWTTANRLSGDILHWLAFFEKLKSNCSHDVLDSISVGEAYTIAEDYTHGDILTIDILDPLLSFRHLVTLECDMPGGFDLCDDDVRDMADAWPALQSLDLSSRVGWRTRSRVTIRGIAHLVRACPRLLELGIVIDASVVDDCSKKDSGVHCQNEQIHALSLGNSEIADPVAVAALLSDILPNVRTVVSWDTKPRLKKMSLSQPDPSAVEIAQFQSKWRQVEGLIGAFATVRKDERARKSRLCDA